MAKQLKLIKEIPNFWRPEFIPFYPAEKEKYKMNDKETVMYGFIRHFLKNCSGKFFFTNEQLRYVLGNEIKKDNSISRIISGLCRKCPEVSANYTRKEGGGKNRYMAYINQNPNLAKKRSVSSQKSDEIENTIKNTLNTNIGDWFNNEIIIKDNEHKHLLLEEKQKFLDYWTEGAPKRERWQKEPVFDIKRRWKRWLLNVEAKMKPKVFIKEPTAISRGGGMTSVGELLNKYKK